MKQAALVILCIVLSEPIGAHAQDSPWGQGERIAARGAVNRNVLVPPPQTSGPYAMDSLQSGPRELGKDAGLDLKPVAGLQSIGEEFEAAKIIARVGDEVVLAGDVLGQVNQFLHKRMQDVPEAQRAQITPEMMDQQRWVLVKQLLPSIIDSKLIYLDFLRTIPKDKVPEIQDSLFKAFDEQQLPVVIERAKVQTAADLDRLLRSFGSSVDLQRRSFAEQLAAAQWKQQSASYKKEVTHDDMLAYYREHQDEYHLQAKCKWEQLSALDSQTSSRESSKRLIAQMGNEVLGGASFAAVAKRSSQGPTASQGGVYDWTTQGSLRSDLLDAAIFSLPIGKLSTIVEDDDGCHIIRVVERQDEGAISFGTAQDGIRKQIREERSEAALKDYVAQLHDEFPIWTFDEEATSSAP